MHRYRFRIPPVPPWSTATKWNWAVNWSPAKARQLTLTVREDGSPVTDLQPYLAAFGHLVVLRAGDLAYVHVHPNGEPGDGVTAPGPDITFHTVAPGPGVYRLFLDFKHRGTVRTAAFTLPTTTTHRHH